MNRSDLHNYQVKCVQHIIDNPYCGLFIHMGLGKTISTLTAISDLMFDYLEVNHVLVVAPKRVVETVWQEEAEKWEHTRHLRVVKVIGIAHKREEALHQKADIHVISRDNVMWLCEYYNYILPYDMVVLDELSSFKNIKSKRFKAMKEARPHIKRVVGLTGTPSPNGLLDLWPELYLLDRGQRLEKTITRYKAMYFRPGLTNGHVVYKYNLVEGADKAIHNKISDICISMKAEDYLEMPELTNNYIKLKLPPEIKKQYDDFEKNKILELMNEGTEINVMNAAGLSNKLLQFANGAMYDGEGNVHAIHDIKLEALKEIIEDSNGQNVLVAWTYKFDRDRILEYLKEYNPRELKTKEDIDEWNKGNVQVMLAHPMSAGHGLNLQTGGSTIIWYGQTWSLELYQQFNGRLFRQGQQHHVVIHHLIAEGTHDEDVIKALHRKDKGQNELMESIKAKMDKYKNLFTS